MQRRNLFAILIIISAVSAPTGCGPSVNDPVTAAIAGKSAQEVVSSAEYSARIVVQESEKAGSALMTQGANQLDVLAHNVEAQLDADITRHVKELSEENRKLLYELEKMRQTAVAMSASAFRLKDSTILDLKDLSGDSWFAKKHSYWVQRVGGLTQVLNPAGAEYEVSVLGIGFGTDTDDRRTKILQVLVDGKPITDARII